jgi:transcriptional regulator with XRE-family HTH domain
MATSRMPKLSKPQGRAKISSAVLAYFRARTRMRLFNIVRRELIRSGITKAELAERLGKGPDQVSRWLAMPGNWTLDTVSDLLFATTACELSEQVAYPLDAPEAQAKPEIKTPSEASTPPAARSSADAAGVAPKEKPPEQRPKTPLELEPPETQGQRDRSRAFMPPPEKRAA